MGIIKSVVQSTPLARLDAWFNEMTGMGSTKDKTQYGQFVRGPWLQDDTLRALYEQNDIAQTLVALLPEEMFRKGVVLDHAQAERLKEEARRLELVKRFQETVIWGRLFGGGVGVMGLDDGRKDEQELVPEAVTAFRFFEPFDETATKIHAYYADKRDHRYGRPAIFEINDRGSTFLVHETRCVVFGGAHTTKKTREDRQGWDLSVLQAPHDAMRSFGSAFGALEHLLLDASVGVFTLRGLIGKLTSDQGRSELNTRASVMDLWRNVTRSILLDQDGEKYERVDANFSGVDGAMQAFILRLAAAGKIPVTVLMGQSPAGLNATGASDVRLFYSRVETEQEQIKPDLARVFGLLARALKLDPNVGVSFPSLWSETPPEKATREKTEAEADAVYVTQQVLLPEEVAKRRFTGATYVDMKLRETGHDSGTVVLTPSDAANVITVNEARASMKLDPLPGPDGLLTLSAYAAKTAAIPDASAAGAKPGPDGVLIGPDGGRYRIGPDGQKIYE